jgi:hypothetical protein
MDNNMKFEVGYKLSLKRGKSFDEHSATEREREKWQSSERQYI